MPKRSYALLVTGLLCLVLASPALAARVERVEERYFPLTEDGSVSVKNVAGRILVHAGEEAQVKMMATKSVRALREKEAEEFLERIEIDVTAREDRLEIVTRYPVSSWWSGLKSFSYSTGVDYELWVPQGAAVRTESISGDIRIEERYNCVQAHTVSGDIELTSIWGDIDVETTSGDIHTENTKGTIIVRSISGDIKILGAKGAARTMKTVSGDIFVELEEIDEAALQMNLKSISGDIEFFLPPDVQADIDVGTISGKISTDFEITIRGTVGIERELQATIGGGGVSIELKTTSGDITLKKL